MSDDEGIDGGSGTLSEEERQGDGDLYANDVDAEYPPVDKRAHHNALERKRRDHIKESFCSLRDCIPNLVGEKVSNMARDKEPWFQNFIFTDKFNAVLFKRYKERASRAQILKKATNYITSMKSKNQKYQSDIDAIRSQNKELEREALLKIKSTTNFATTGALNTEAMGYTETEMREDNPETPPKKVKSG